MTRPKVAVIGGGVFGLWTALALLSRGAQVELLDGHGVGNEHGMSVAPYRLIRALYGDRHLYIKLVAESLRDWNKLQADERASLFEQVGVWWMFPNEAPQFVLDALPVCGQYDLPVFPVSLEDASRQFPHVNYDGIASIYLDESAGFLRADKCCQALFTQFLKQGGKYRWGHVSRIGDTVGNNLRRLACSDRDWVEADHYVFACGPWLKDLFGELFGKITLTRQLEYYFELGSALNGKKAPVMIDFGDGDSLFYGLHDPAERCFKIGDDKPHGLIDTSLNQEATEQEIENGQSLLEKRFPGLEGIKLKKARVCRYDRTPLHDLIADKHPGLDNVWIVGGGSGHGFKTSPAVGRYMSRLVLDEITELIPEFGIRRMQGLQEALPGFAVSA
jgi:glycine/D-amino acid oxidase-like deaminating enzyme